MFLIRQVKNLNRSPHLYRHHTTGLTRGGRPQPPPPPPSPPPAATAAPLQPENHPDGAGQGAEDERDAPEVGAQETETGRDGSGGGQEREPPEQRQQQQQSSKRSQEQRTSQLAVIEPFRTLTSTSGTRRSTPTQTRSRELAIESRVDLLNRTSKFNLVLKLTLAALWCS